MCFFHPTVTYFSTCLLALSFTKLFAEELHANLKHAVCASLLLLPESFSMHSLVYKIAELSYGGDIRVGIAEDPYKVS